MRIGIIGCGTVVQTSYALALPKVPDTTVSYVYDLNRSAASLVAKKLRAKAGSIDDVLHNSDVVIIATPPATHFEIVKTCLTASKAVVCEKPFVGHVAEARELVSLASERKLRLFVAHFRRCFPSVQLARQIIESGILGNVREIRAYEGGRFNWQTESAYITNDSFGGVLFDTGSHTLDLALYAAALDIGVLNVKVSNVVRDKPEPSHEIQATFTFSYAAGSGKGRLFLSRYQALANKVSIVLEHGIVEFPVGLSNKVRIVGQKGTSIVSARDSYEDIMDCFALQYNYMFSPECENIFFADRFVNLTGLLEAIGLWSGVD